MPMANGTYQPSATQQVNVTAGQTTNLRISMVAGGTITGRVLDPQANRYLRRRCRFFNRVTKTECRDCSWLTSSRRMTAASIGSIDWHRASIMSRRVRGLAVWTARLSPSKFSGNSGLDVLSWRHGAFIGDADQPSSWRRPGRHQYSAENNHRGQGLGACQHDCPGWAHCRPGSQRSGADRGNRAGPHEHQWTDEHGCCERGHPQRRRRDL